MTTIRAGLYGLILADAVGVPAENRAREDLRCNPITEMVGGDLHQQPVGYWSDDSSMTLCLANSIGKLGYYHTHDIMWPGSITGAATAHILPVERSLTSAIPAPMPSAVIVGAAPLPCAAVTR